MLSGHRERAPGSPHRRRARPSTGASAPTMPRNNMYCKFAREQLSVTADLRQGCGSPVGSCCSPARVQLNILNPWSKNSQKGQLLIDRGLRLPHGDNRKKSRRQRFRNRCNSPFRSIRHAFRVKSAPHPHRCILQRLACRACGWR